MRNATLLFVVAIGLAAVPVAGAHSIPATKPVAVQDIKSKAWLGAYEVSKASCKPIRKSRAGRVGNKPAFRHYNCVIRVIGDGAQDPTIRWKFRYHATGRQIGRWKATNVRQQCWDGTRWQTVGKNDTCVPDQLGDAIEYGPFGIYERVNFDPGTTGKIVSDGVARGTVNGYILGAQAGQGMILQLNSPDAVKTFGLAVMDVYSPRVFTDGYTNDTLLASGTQFFRGELTETGDYLVIVQSSAGGASYDLDIVIQDVG